MMRTGRRRIPAEIRAIVPLLPYQREDVVSDARFNWCCWSRQVGKSFTKALRRLLRGIERRRDQILLSAGERQSRELMLKVQQHCRALNLAAGMVGSHYFKHTSYAQLALELPNGVRVIALPANPETARGYTGDVLLDEFAMHRDDRAIWASIFPAILRGGGELDIASTPKGAGNLFAELRDNPQFRHSTVRLRDAIHQGLDVDEEALRASMNDDDLFAQEFECAFLEEVSAFLPMAKIAACEDAQLEKTFDLEVLRELEGPLYAGVDIGRHRDLTVFWVVRRAGERLMTCGLWEAQGCAFREQSDMLAATLRLPGMHRCAIDAGGIGMPLAEEALEKFGAFRVEAVTFTPRVKDELATGLRLQVEAGTLRIPVDEAIRNDWHSVQRSVTTSGPPRYTSGRSGLGHADRFWAACLAVRAAGAGAIGEIEGMRGRRLRFSGWRLW